MPSTVKIKGETHCHSAMVEERIALMSGNLQVNCRCLVCGQKERSVYSKTGALLSWRNISVAGELSGGV